MVDSIQETVRQAKIELEELVRERVEKADRQAIPETLDLKGLEKLFGWAHGTAKRYRQREWLPEPDGVAGRSPWWYREVILNWAILTNRIINPGPGEVRPGRNPKRILVDWDNDADTVDTNAMGLRDREDREGVREKAREAGEVANGA